MSEELKKEEQVDPQQKKLFGEGRGRYSLLDNAKIYTFDFPITATLEDNFSAISFMKEEILKAIKVKLSDEEPKKGKEKPFSKVTDEAIKDTEEKKADK